MKLSKRLEAVANLITSDTTVADIGTDHAYIPIFLLKENRIKRALAMDVNVGPLERAREHIVFERLQTDIELRLSDGAKALKTNEADCVVIAGMGGNLILHILEDGKEVLGTVYELILQPQSDIARVRRYLFEQDYTIEQEDMVVEDGKYYPMFRVIHQKEKNPYKEVELLYGRNLIKQKHPVLIQFLEKEEKQYLDIYRHLKDLSANDTNQKRLFELEQKIKLVQEARLEMFDK